MSEFHVSVVRIGAVGSTRTTRSVCFYGRPVHPAMRDDLAEHAEGASVLARGACIREGFVVRPTRERFDERIGRVIAKLVGETYHTRKGG